MTTNQRRLETLVLVALGKAYNDYSTILTKELKFQTKFDFNNSVNAINTFVKCIESKLTHSEVEFLEDITELISNYAVEVKKGVTVIKDVHLDGLEDLSNEEFAKKIAE